MKTLFAQERTNMRETESEAAGWQRKAQRMFGVYTDSVYWFVYFPGDDMHGAALMCITQTTAESNETTWTTKQYKLTVFSYVFLQYKALKRIHMHHSNMCSLKRCCCCNSVSMNLHYVHHHGVKLALVVFCSVLRNVDCWLFHGADMALGQQFNTL